MQTHLTALADESAESSVRRAAALAIGALRDQATPSDVAQVLEHLSSTHDCEVGGGAISVRRAALLAFTELARGDDGVPAAVASGVTQVTELTQADDEATREMAVRAMAVLGAHADAHSVVLRLQDSEEDVRAAAADTLTVLADTLAVTDLEAIAARLPTPAGASDGDDADAVRATALQTLGAVAAAAPRWRDHALLPSLAAATAACLADEAPPTRAAALGALAAFGPMASAAHLDAVAALLEDEAAAVRVAAVGALGRLGSAESHAEALSELLGDPDRGVRGAVTGALKQWEAA